MRVFLLACAVFTLAAQTQDPERLMAQGVEAYRNGRYAAAAEHFAAVVKIDPGYSDAHLYLGTAYMAQTVPGSDDASNLRLAMQAIDEFQQVLYLDPEHEGALSSIAAVYYNQKKYDDAQEWYEKLTSLDSDNKQAWYKLGVIAWNRFYPAQQAARAKAGMKPDDPGPLPDASARQELRQRYAAIVAEGLENLQKALTIDPEYDDAMAYLNLLTRERADWLDSAADYRKEIAAADAWMQKSLETKKRKAERRLQP